MVTNSPTPFCLENLFLKYGLHHPTPARNLFSSLSRPQFYVLNKLYH